MRLRESQRTNKNFYSIIGALECWNVSTAKRFFRILILGFRGQAGSKVPGIHGNEKEEVGRIRKS